MAERTLDVAALIEGKLARPQIRIALWLCTLMVLEGYDMQTLSFATPAILREWHVSRADFGFVLTAHLVGYFVGAMALSFFGDRIGRKNIIVAGAVIFGAFTFAAGFATSPVGAWAAGASARASGWAAPFRPALRSRRNTCPGACARPRSA